MISRCVAKLRARPLFLAFLVLKVVLFIAVPLAAHASDRADRFAEMMERVDEAKARLHLTPDQERDIAPILKAGRDKRLDILEKYGFGQGTQPHLSLRKKVSLGREMKAVRADTEKKLSRYLSSEQMAEYRKIQDENRDRMRAMMQKR